MNPVIAFITAAESMESKAILNQLYKAFRRHRFAKATAQTRQIIRTIVVPTASTNTTIKLSGCEILCKKSCGKNSPFEKRKGTDIMWFSCFLTSGTGVIILLTKSTKTISSDRTTKLWYKRGDDATCREVTLVVKYCCWQIPTGANFLVSRNYNSERDQERCRLLIGLQINQMDRFVSS